VISGTAPPHRESSARRATTASAAAATATPYRDAAVRSITTARRLRTRATRAPRPDHARRGGRSPACRPREGPDHRAEARRARERLVPRARSATAHRPTRTHRRRAASRARHSPRITGTAGRCRRPARMNRRRRPRWPENRSDSMGTSCRGSACRATVAPARQYALRGVFAPPPLAWWVRRYSAGGDRSPASCRSPRSGGRSGRDRNRPSSRLWRLRRTASSARTVLTQPLASPGCAPGAALTPGRPADRATCR
jgi:hypothetical protein